MAWGGETHPSLFEYPRVVIMENEKSGEPAKLRVTAFAKPPQL